jgi:hypothetical protein
MEKLPCSPALPQIRNRLRPPLLHAFQNMVGFFEFLRILRSASSRWKTEPTGIADGALPTSGVSRTAKAARGYATDCRACLLWVMRLLECWACAARPRLVANQTPNAPCDRWRERFEHQKKKYYKINKLSHM